MTTQHIDTDTVYQVYYVSLNIMAIYVVDLILITNTSGKITNQGRSV